MKKLLALVLCVMLLVSVIPTTAFAEEADAIDLSELYAAVDALYLAYNNLGYATLVFNFNSAFGEAILEYAALDTAVSYEGLFALVGGTIYGAWIGVAQEFVGDLAADVNAAAEIVTAAAAAIGEAAGAFGE